MQKDLLNGVILSPCITRHPFLCHQYHVLKMRAMPNDYFKSDYAHQLKILVLVTSTVALAA